MFPNSLSAKNQCIIQFCIIWISEHNFAPHSSGDIVLKKIVRKGIGGNSDKFRKFKKWNSTKHIINCSKCHKSKQDGILHHLHIWTPFFTTYFRRYWQNKLLLCWKCIWEIWTKCVCVLKSSWMLLQQYKRHSPMMCVILHHLHVSA